MSDFINTIDALGDDAVMDSIIERTITEFKDDRITKLANYALNGASALAVVDMPKLTRIEQVCLSETALIALILRNAASVCTLLNGNAFNSTPIASGTGYIYVPAALIDSYKAATNWSTYAAQFRAIEDYTVDGTITGELDETKI